MFVRTDENNIYEIDNDSHYIKDGYVYFKGIEEILGGNPENYKSKIIKQADTIEELCDEFIVYDTHKKKWLHFVDLKSLIAYCDMNGLDKTSIKGAIWTDEGLIYVAKMNERGELELL